ncbi:hypothetical protein D3C76_1367370 [compost metagenome]
MAWWIKVSRAETSTFDALLPASAGRPKFTTEVPAGVCSVASALSNDVVLSSHARSRSTEAFNWVRESTRLSALSLGLVGSSSVNRSSRDGCRRSRVATSVTTERAPYTFFDPIGQGRRRRTDSHPRPPMFP